MPAHCRAEAAARRAAAEAAGAQPKTSSPQANKRRAIEMGKKTLADFKQHK